MRKSFHPIDGFCRKHPNFGIPNLMKYICIASSVFWLVGMINPSLLNYITFNPYKILHGELWRLVSFAMYPPSTGVLTFVAIYFYYLIGNVLEREWGTARFTLYFLMGLVLTVLYGFLMYFVFRINFILSAQYIYLSMFFSFAVIFPDMQVLLFFILPIKIKYLAIVDAALFIVSMFSTPFPGSLLPLVAIINFLLFCGGELLNRLPRKPSAQTVNFRKASEKIRKEQQASLYTHKCAVCGRTDKDHPELEFRYCSKCQGYHCFCQDHIFNHIHFTE